jgi:predicted MFS family arabinose efflux permease
MYGRRLMFTIGLAIFTVGSLLCGLSTGPLFLVLARAGQGIGGAIMFATSLALLAQAFSGRERGRALAVWGAVTGVAVAVTLWRVAESRDPRPRGIDWAGVVLFTGALSALVYGLIRAGEQGWGDSGVPICLAGAAVLLAAFLIVEWRLAHPMFDLALFRVPTFAGASVAAFAINGCVYAMLLYLVLYLQDLLGYTPLQTGLRLLLTSAVSLPAAIASGRLSNRVPARLILGTGLALSGVGLLLMAGLTAGSDWTHLIGGLVLAGLVNPALAGAAVGVVQPRAAGMASGISSTFRQVGIATGIAVFGTLFTTRLTSGIVAGLHGTPLAGRAGQIAAAVSQGQARQAFGELPPGAQQVAGEAVRSAFTSGLNEILVVGGTGALVAAAAAAILVRRKDFVAHGPAAVQPAAGEPAPAGQAR